MNSSGEFTPRRWLRSPHVQSALASSGMRRWLFRHRRAALEQVSTEHILDCGGGARLQGFHTRQTALAQPRALAVLLHGWEGSAQSSYILHTGSRLLAEGCDVFRLNFRDHGQTHHLNSDLFHSCRIDEVVGAVRQIADRFSERPLLIGGFSLGGNFALRVALHAPAAGIPLSWVFAVCPVISPRAGLVSIENAPWFYERYFMHKWRGSLLRKQALHPDRELFSKSELRAGHARADADDGVAAHRFRLARELSRRLLDRRGQARGADDSGDDPDLRPTIRSFRSPSSASSSLPWTAN
jgi:predicted alpha/beta-fold hydrolase